MKISKINGQEYYEGLVEKILREDGRLEFLRDQRMHAKGPYDFNSTGDEVTLLFEKDDVSGKSFLRLPFETNVNTVSNITDYPSHEKSPKILDEIKDFFIRGKISVYSETLNEFLAYLKENEPTNLLHITHVKSTQGEDVTENYKVKYKPKGINLAEKLEDIKKNFINSGGGGLGFLIDPDSSVRVKKIERKNGSEIYNVSLGSQKYLGLSGIPGIDTSVYQIIKAKVR